MTPLVDLGFLLISFFIFTTTLSQPGIMRLIMPKQGNPTPVRQSKALTFLLDRDKAFAYEGRWEDAGRQHRIRATAYGPQGLGTLLQQKQKSMGNKDELFVLIKPLPGASYQRVIEALDEMNIHAVNTYALVDASREEAAFLHRP